MVVQTEVQHIRDAEGKEIRVIPPIDLWHEIESEHKTAHLLKGGKRQGGISLENAIERLGV